MWCSSCRFLFLHIFLRNVDLPSSREQGEDSIAPFGTTYYIVQYNATKATVGIVTNLYR